MEGSVVVRGTRVIAEGTLAGQVIEAAPLAWIVVDRTGGIIYVNAATERLFGWPRQSLDGRAITDLLPEVAPAGKWRRTTAMRSDGSEIAVDVQVRGAKLESEPLVLVIVRDVREELAHELALEAAVTALEAARAELERQNVELERLDEQKNALLGMAAHDLRNPLGVISGYASYALDHLESLPADEVRELLRVISRSSRFMRGLVDDLLDVAIIESGKLDLECRALAPIELVRERVRASSPLAAQKAIPLRADVAADLPAVLVDPDRFQQAFDNLVSNAIKYSEPGKDVTIRARLVGSEIVFTIEDAGRGIAPELAARLFQPFVKEGRPGTRGEKSTGLGLAIVRRIAEAHRGRVWVVSELGRGSAFHLAVPISSPSQTGGNA